MIQFRRFQVFFKNPGDYDKAVGILAQAGVQMIDVSKMTPPQSQGSSTGAMVNNADTQFFGRFMPGPAARVPLSDM